MPISSPVIGAIPAQRDIEIYPGGWAEIGFILTDDWVPYALEFVVLANANAGGTPDLTITEASTRITATPFGSNTIVVIGNTTTAEETQIRAMAYPGFELRAVSAGIDPVILVRGRIMVLSSADDRSRASTDDVIQTLLRGPKGDQGASGTAPVVWNALTTYPVNQLVFYPGPGTTGQRAPVYFHTSASPAGDAPTNRATWIPFGSMQAFYVQTQAAFEAAYAAVADGETFEMPLGNVTVNTPMVLSAHKNIKGKHARGYLAGAAGLSRQAPIVTLSPTGNWPSGQIDYWEIISSGGGKHALLIDVSTGSKSLPSYKMHESLFQAGVGLSIPFAPGGLHTVGQIVYTGATQQAGPYFEKINTDATGSSVTDNTHWRVWRAYGLVVDAGRGGVPYDNGSYFPPGTLVQDGGLWWDKISTAPLGTPTSDGTAWEWYPFAAYIYTPGITAGSRDGFALVNFNHNTYNGGLFIIGLGDSNVLNHIRVDGPNTGMRLRIVADTILRSSSSTTVRNLNSTANGGFWLDSGQNVTLEYPNLELHDPIHDQPAGRRGIVRLAGTPGFPVRACGVFGGAVLNNVNSNAQSGLYVENAVDCWIDGGTRFTKPSLANGIVLTDTCLNFYVGHVMPEPSLNYMTGAPFLIDNGIGTKGNWKDIDFQVAGAGTLVIAAGTDVGTGTGTPFTANDVGKTITNVATGEKLVIRAFSSATGINTVGNAVSAWAGAYKIAHFMPRALVNSGTNTISAGAGSNAFTCTLGVFTAADQGRTLVVNDNQVFVIANVSSPTTFTTINNTVAAIVAQGYRINGSTNAYESPQFMKDKENMVHLKGDIMAAGLSAGSLPAQTGFATFPNGHRPDKLVRLNAVSDVASVMTTCQLEVSNVTGEMKVFRASLGNAGLSLNGMKFYSPPVPYLYV